MSAPTVSDSVQWTASTGFAVWLNTESAAHPWLQSLYLQQSAPNLSGVGGVLMVPVGHGGNGGTVAARDGDWLVQLSTGAVAVLASS